jgi:hypothetical protein
MTVPQPGPPPRPADPQENVSRALARLDGLDGRPLAEHVDAFEQVHAALGDALAGPSGPE